MDLGGFNFSKVISDGFNFFFGIRMRFEIGPSPRKFAKLSKILFLTSRASVAQLVRA